jgi:hypothetical protein
VTNKLTREKIIWMSAMLLHAGAYSRARGTLLVISDVFSMIYRSIGVVKLPNKLRDLLSGGT